MCRKLWNDDVLPQVPRYAWWMMRIGLTGCAILVGGFLLLGAMLLVTVI